MPDAVWVAASATAGVALTDWWAVATGARSTERWAKPAVMVGLLVVALLAGAGGTVAGRWAVAALALGLVGDVLLLDDTAGRFVGGLSAFLLGHLAWMGAFVTTGLERPAMGWVGVVVVLLALVAGRAVVPAAVREGGVAMGGAVTAYMVVIATMAVLGWATGRFLVGAGATLFVVSDTVLARGRFVTDTAWSGPVVMVSYHLAQALMLAGLLVS